MSSEIFANIQTRIGNGYIKMITSYGDYTIGVGRNNSDEEVTLDNITLEQIKTLYKNLGLLLELDE